MQNDIGTLSIKGAVEGTEETAAAITARAQALLVQNQLTDVAFGNINIGGSARNALILAGYNTTTDVSSAGEDPDAQMSAVSVAGDWIASDLVAGARWDANYGTSGDALLSVLDQVPGGPFLSNNPKIISTIAKITIEGQIIGTGANTTAHFGSVARHIIEMKIGPDGSPLVLNAFKRNENDPTALRYNVAGTGDVRLFEIA